MLIRKIVAAVVTALSLSCAFAQDVGPVRPGVDRAVNGEAVTGRPVQGEIPIDDTPIYGERLTGLDAPEGEAIRMLFDTPYRINSLLSEADRFLFISARAASKNREASSINMEAACRRALSLNSKAVSKVEAADLGRQLNDAEESYRQAVVDLYHAMLENMSDTGAKIVNDEKIQIHRSIVSLIFDWEAQSQVDAQKFISTYSANCEKPPQQ